VSSPNEDWAVIASGNVRLTWLDDLQTEERLNRQEPVVDEIWQKLCRQRSGGLFDGDVLRWIGCEKRGTDLLIRGAYVKYRHYMASKQRPDLRLDIFPIGVSGLTFLSEGAGRYAVLARRAANVTSYPGRLELVPSGSIDKTYAAKDGAVDYRGQLLSEFCDETGLSAACVKKIVPFACVMDKRDGIYDICCRIDINTKREVLLKAFAASREYQEPRLIAEGDLQDFVHSHRDSIIPSSIALLEAYTQAGKTESGS
jgi:hypothetical protein